jgi:hypothetical protein
MSTMTCERALQLAGQTKLSGEALSAHWHVQHCPHCQRTMSELWTQITVLNDRLALQKLLDIDLGEAICQQTGRVITWLVRGTRQVLATVIRLGEPTAPLTYAPQLATLGATDVLRPQDIWQEAGQSPDASLAWKVTFIVDSADPEQCRAEVEVSLFDRWDLSGVDVLLIWEGDQRRGQTDDQGQVLFTDIPAEAWGRISVIVHPPQLPVSTNGPQ